jgi:hypothetical protein
VPSLSGDPQQDFDQAAALLRGDPQNAGAWAELVRFARQAGRVDEAKALCLRAYEAEPRLFRALNALLHLTSDAPGSVSAVTPPVARPSLSIIACSHQDERYAAMAATYDRALGDWPHEFVRIADATSLAGGYSRGLAASNGELVVFSHDDVELLASDFGPRLALRLSECDVLGVAGAVRASGPAWPYAGWPYLHGAIVYPEGSGYRVAVYSRSVPLAEGLRVMDGVFLAMKREVALKIGWDAQTCDGFHGYDVDFTLRAAQSGLRLAAASDLGLVHRSSGSFDERWVAAARKLAARHPELNGTRGAETGPVLRSVPSAAHALALIDRWARPGVPG